MIRTLKELFGLTHAAGLHLCVWSCERDVEQAKQRLADALAAQDRLRAEQAIAAHTEQPTLPASLFRSKP
jgi:hypothetical protein